MAKPLKRDHAAFHLAYIVYMRGTPQVLVCQTDLCVREQYRAEYVL